MAKRLHGGLYESKCGDQLRIVHLLHDVERYYGSFDSFWAFSETPEDVRLRESALLAAYQEEGIEPAQPAEDAASAIDAKMVALFENAAAAAKVEWWARYRAIHPRVP